MFTKSDDQITKDLIPLLEYGMVAVVIKPESEDNMTAVRDQLLQEIRANAKAKI